VDESSETSARKDRTSGIKERQKGRARREASVKEREKGEEKKETMCSKRSRATYGALAGSLAYYATELVSLFILSLSLLLSFSSFFGSITFLPDSASFVLSVGLFTLNSLAESLRFHFASAAEKVHRFERKDERKQGRRLRQGGRGKQISNEGQQE